MHCTSIMSGSGDSLPLILIGHSTAGYMHCWHQLLTVGQDYILLQNPETSLRSGEGLPSAEMLSCCRLYRACARLRIMTSYVVYASVTLVYWPDAAASFHSPIELISWTFTIHRFPVQLVSISSSALWKEGRHISSHHCIHPFERESYHDDYIRLDSLSTLEVCDLLKTNGFDEDVVEIFLANEIHGGTLLELNSSDFKELGLIALGDRAGNNANKTRSSETNTSGSHKVLHSFFELWFSKTFTYIWYFTACTLYTSHFQNVATVSSVRVILTHPLQIVQQAILAIFVIRIYIVIQAVKGGLLIHIWICFHVMHYHHHHTCMHIGWGRWRRGYWYLHTQQGRRRQQIGRCECYTMRIVCMFHWWQRGAYVRTLRQLRVL